MSEEKTEKRRFSRVPFDADVLLSQNDEHWRTKLLDISLNGILVETPNGWNAELGERFSLELIFTDSGSLITGEVSIAHMEDQHVGCKMVNIDVESVAHLRRLIELNLGDPDLMDRELAALHWR